MRKALEAVERLPVDQQDDIARLLLDLAAPTAKPEEIEPDHLAGVLIGLDEARRGVFATEDEVTAAFRRFG